jgi:hypothetical protein
MSTTRHRSGGSGDVSQANPHAERISPEEFGRLVKNFYGTKTVLFDRQFAEVVLAYNTGNRRVTRRNLDANRTRVHSPLRRGFTSVSNRRRDGRSRRDSDWRMVLPARTARRPRDEGEWRLVKRQKPNFRMPWLDPIGRSSRLKAAVLLGALLPGDFLG